MRDKIEIWGEIVKKGEEYKEVVKKLEELTAGIGKPNAPILDDKVVEYDKKERDLGCEIVRLFDELDEVRDKLE